MFEKAADFIRECKGSTIIIYDSDGDGIGAAVIVARTLKRLFGRYSKAMPGNHDLPFNKYVKKGTDSIIIVDISVDRKAEHILKLAKKHKILIIDHHQTNKNLNRYKNIVHINPYLWESRIPSFRYASSKIAFDICKKVADIEDLDWLAGMGIINDYSGISWKGFLNKLYKKYPYLKGRNLYSFENKLGYINNLVTSGHYSKSGGIKLGFDACLKAESPLDIIKLKTASAKKLKKMYDRVEKEIRYVVKNWGKKAEIIESKKLIILRLKTRFSINSPVSTKISIKKPHYTVVVARKSGNKIHISFRRQDRKVNCSELASKATKNLKNASGGGHATAAGGRIMARDWNKFKKNIIRYL